MKDRIVTSIGIVVLLLLIGLINNPYLTGLFIAIITVAGMWEAKKLFGADDLNVFYFLGFMSFLAVFSNPVFIALVCALAVGAYVAYYQKDLSNAAMVFYPFLPMMLLLDLYHKTSMATIGWLIVIIAATDSFAYLIGKNFARKFFSNGFCKTSPNKSWEGVIAGVLLASMIGSLVGLVVYDFPKTLFVAFMVSVAGVFGDLFESYLKRRAGVKDSGNILPGHGGILDRIDAYLFGGPLMWGLLVLS